MKSIQINFYLLSSILCFAFSTGCLRLANEDLETTSSSNLNEEMASNDHGIAADSGIQPMITANTQPRVHEAVQPI